MGVSPMLRIRKDIMDDKPQRVIFLSVSAGAGHNQAAAAVIAGLKQARPDLRTEFIDVMGKVPAWYRAFYAGGYNILVTHLPSWYGFGYGLFDHPQTPQRGLSEKMRMAFERFEMRRLTKYLLSQRPALVVCTHYLPMPLVGRLIGRGEVGLRLMGVVTDNEAHRWWYSENVERYFAPNEDVKRLMGRWAIDPQKITVSGIPVHPKWTAPLDRRKILADWQLPSDRPIVMLSGGTFFTVGPTEHIARGILDKTNACVVVLAGRNKQLQADLASFPEAGERLKIVPFTDRVHELADVCTVMVTKAGGLTTSECIAKGVAMILTKSVPGQEEANARMLEAEGAAIRAEEIDDIIAAVTDLLAHPGKVKALSDNARRLYHPGTQIIVDSILATLA